MEQSPWEANSRLAGKKFPYILRDPRVHYSGHKTYLVALF
jgi:hypothetical protein